MSGELKRHLTQRAADLLQDCELMTFMVRVQCGKWRITIEETDMADLASKEPDNTEDDPPQTICAGPPACELQDNDAVLAMRAGCIWCRRITVHEDGRETETGPGHA